MADDQQKPPSVTKRDRKIAESNYRAADASDNSKDAHALEVDELTRLLLAEEGRAQYHSVRAAELARAVAARGNKPPDNAALDAIAKQFDHDRLAARHLKNAAVIRRRLARIQEARAKELRSANHPKWSVRHKSTDSGVLGAILNALAGRRSATLHDEALLAGATESIRNLIVHSSPMLREHDRLNGPFVDQLALVGDQRELEKDLTLALLTVLAEQNPAMLAQALRAILRERSEQVTDRRLTHRVGQLLDQASDEQLRAIHNEVGRRLESRREPPENTQGS